MINNTNVENKHTTNGVLATVYPITFQGAATDSGTPHLRVMLKTADGTSIRQLVYNVDYELVREEIDPTVPQTESMSVPPVVGIKLLNAEDATAGNSLTITRETPFVQDIDFQVGRIDPEQVEDTADLSVLRDQELSHKFDKVAEMPLDHETRITELELDVANIDVLIPSEATPINKLADKGYVGNSIDSATDEIYDLIPTQATAQNKLADKEFVNSSIATNTATFRGTYNSVTELNAYSGEKDNNDYAFVTGTDSLGNPYYDNYVYNGESWTFRWRLNNSSFTAAQWTAINSNVTQADVLLARSALQPGDFDGMSGRSVGDIFYTIRKDNNLNGAVECNGATYNTTDFIGAQSIGALLAAGKIPYISLASYEYYLGLNGSVAKFGWDGPGTTTFRVPSLNDIFIETASGRETEFIPAGLPLPTMTLGMYVGGGDTWQGVVGNTYTYSRNRTVTANTDGIYGNSDTVQPKAARYRAMVQLAVTASDEAVETCTGVLAQVAANTAAIAGADYVVDFQRPTAANYHTWYRKYKSGWVEQGGVATTTNTSTPTQCNLPVTMADGYYCITYGPTTQNMASVFLADKQTTYFSVITGVQNIGYFAVSFNWMVCGMAAS